MAFPIIYLCAAANGAMTNSGCTDSATPLVSGIASASVSGNIVTFTGSPDLASVLTDGSHTIFINDATNANCKIFRITDVDNSAKTVTLDGNASPSGTITASNWSIGGRVVFPTSTTLEGALKAGWTLEMTEDISTSTVFTARNSGNYVDGPIFFRGRLSGNTRPKLTMTGAAHTAYLSPYTDWIVSDLHFDNTANSQSVLAQAATCFFFNCKFEKSAGTAANVIYHSGGSSTSEYYGCEITGAAALAGYSSQTAGMFCGCNIHDIVGTAIEITSVTGGVTVDRTVINNCGGRGVHQTNTGVASATIRILQSTIANCGSSGLEVADAESRILIVDSIFKDNGDATGEYNIELLSTNRWKFSSNNIFHHTDGSKNLQNFTASSKDFVTDPLLTGLVPGDGSPALLAALKASGITPSFDIGAMQRPGDGNGSSQVIGGGL